MDSSRVVVCPARAPAAKRTGRTSGVRDMIAILVFDHRATNGCRGGSGKDGVSAEVGLAAPLAQDLLVVERAPRQIHRRGCADLEGAVADDLRRSPIGGPPPLEVPRGLPLHHRHPPQSVVGDALLPPLLA